MGLQTDHAGETGAVMIYRGILAVTRDQTLRAFAHHHFETERRYLASIEEIVPSRWRSVLLPLWRLSGWLTGALPAFVGTRAVYATVGRGRCPDDPADTGIPAALARVAGRMPDGRDRPP
jgi:ubiquinone biosynthesis monooxygenase Coq7